LVPHDIQAVFGAEINPLLGTTPTGHAHRH
jgi:hypothetical protein